MDALRPLTSAERKAIPIHAGVLRYFPDALAAVARVSKAGNDKHNPGEPLHWAREKSVDQLECLVRHVLTPDTVDPDTGETHLTHAAWRALAALQQQEEKRLVASGVIPMSGLGLTQFWVPAKSVVGVHDAPTVGKITIVPVSSAETGDHGL